MSDLARHPSEIIRAFRRQPFADPQIDRQALGDGEEIAVTATALIGTTARPGRLVLRARPRSVVWQPYRPLRGYGESVDLAGMRWGGDTDRSGPEAWKIKPVMRVIRLANKQQEHRYAVPASDVELVRTVLNGE